MCVMISRSAMESVLFTIVRSRVTRVILETFITQYLKNERQSAYQYNLPDFYNFSEKHPKNERLPPHERAQKV